MAHEAIRVSLLRRFSRAGASLPLIPKTFCVEAAEIQALRRVRTQRGAIRRWEKLGRSAAVHRERARGEKSPPSYLRQPGVAARRDLRRRQRPDAARIYSATPDLKLPARVLTRDVAPAVRWVGFDGAGVGFPGGREGETRPETSVLAGATKPKLLQTSSCTTNPRFRARTQGSQQISSIDAAPAVSQKASSGARSAAGAR